MCKVGNRHRVNVVRDLFWTPFDVRFSGLLERLREHQELVDIELRIENQKALDDSLDKIYREIREVQIQLHHYATSMEGKLKEQEGLSKLTCETWNKPCSLLKEIGCVRSDTGWLQRSICTSSRKQRTSVSRRLVSGY